MAWYYNLNNQQSGPVDDAGIRDSIVMRKITGSTLVWQTGMEGWQPLSATPLAALLADVPPPLSPAPDAGAAPTPQPQLDADAAPAASSEERMWATFAHLSGLVLGVIGPLVIWLVQKDRFPFVNDQGKEALTSNSICWSTT